MNWFKRKLTKKEKREEEKREEEKREEEKREEEKNPIAFEWKAEQIDKVKNHWEVFVRFKTFPEKRLEGVWYRIGTSVYSMMKEAYGDDNNTMKKYYASADYKNYWYYDYCHEDKIEQLIKVYTKTYIKLRKIIEEREALRIKSPKTGVVRNNDLFISAL